MKITGGIARGRTIASPIGNSVRPTASKMRQALFNILARHISEAAFLDIFAGTGLMGLEALSRGVASLTSIEINKTLALQIDKQAKEFGFKATVKAGDFRQALPGLSEKFDIIFADPPYKTDFAQEVLLLVDQYNLLKEEGMLVIEHLAGLEFICQELSLKQVDYRRYGQSAFSFFAIEK